MYLYASASVSALPYAPSTTFAPCPAKRARTEASVCAFCPAGPSLKSERLNLRTILWS